MHWETGAGSLDLSEPLDLGILNLTPDSFSDGGRFQVLDAAVDQARLLAEAGVGILDLGAESTRPGAEPLDPDLEWARLEPVIHHLGLELPRVPLSLDTRHAEVARRGLAAGISVLNDVTGFSDPDLLALARDSACGLIAMRSRRDGEAFRMPPYDGPGEPDLTVWMDELRDVRDRLLEAGIPPERILLDPGFGFGTTFADDTALWDLLPVLPERLAWPVERFCIGISRKRFVAWRCGQPGLPPALRDAATEALHAEARSLGYRVFRTHALPEPRIRPALPGDAPELARVQVAALQAAYRGSLPGAALAGMAPEPLVAPLARLLEEASPAQPRVWVLERAGRVLGFAATGRPDPPDEHGGGELFALYLHPTAWNRGFGRALLALALDHLDAVGHPCALLWVLERNARARRFYEALGWAPDGGARTVWEGGIALRECRYRLDLKR